MEHESATAAEALNAIIRILDDLDADSRKRVVNAVTTFFHVEQQGPLEGSPTDRPSIAERAGRPSFSTDNTPTPKDFLIEKQPRTDVERIACLAYFLTHYRDTPHFKTLDLAKLNTDAAQPKFSNTAYAATNAVNMGYLAPAVKGTRQLSAAGEQFVRALPDREAAKAAMNRARPRRQQRRKKN
jgi:hypothetical protein